MNVGQGSEHKVLGTRLLTSRQGADKMSGRSQARFTSASRAAPTETVTMRTPASASTHSR